MIAVITVNWNNPGNTLLFLKSLSKLNGSSILPIVVDNASSDNSRELITQDFPTITFLENKVNTGITGGFNRGIDYGLSHGCHYFFLANNDTTIDSDCIESLLKTMHNHSDCGIAIPKIYLMNSRRFYTAGAPGLYNPLGTRGFGQTDRGQYDKEKQLKWCLSTGMLIRKMVFDQCGLFDEDFFIYHEDMEFSRRIIRKGFSIWYEPKAIMWHQPKQSTGMFSDIMFYYSIRNRLLLLKKIPSPIVWKLYSIVIVLTQIIVFTLISFVLLKPSCCVSVYMGYIDFLRNKFGKRKRS